ncbi:ornithine cyclodeaminase family protein [Psychrobacter sp. H8-1]|uniref:ornithine cyclodeaminase family protein n=1 Tax=Psychrobacter sp. H8-1 TaxID=2774129 RepID=UPI00191B81FE|nr:ornithine cyclodeaminase family protein [Psychrobacter sp. H8-1]
MQLLNQAVVAEHLNMQAAIDAIEGLLRLQEKNPNWIKSPDRLVIDTFSEDDNNSQGSHLSMPATIYDGEQEYTAVKLVTICPDNPSRDLPTTTAIITVSKNDTGEILAIMDGIYTTQVRTAALSGIATKYMAKSECESVAVVGCGGMAYEQLHAVLTVRPEIKTVYLWNRSHAGAETFKERFAQNYSQWNVDIKVCEAIDDAICDADVINVATRANEGLFSVDKVKSDAHINAVGAYQPSMKEISDDVIESSSIVVIDDLAGGRHEAGDLIQAHDNSDCSWTWDDISGDLQALVTQKIKKSSDGITLFKSVGAARFDAAVALYVAQQAAQKSLGTSVDW